MTTLHYTQDVVHLNIIQDNYGNNSHYTIIVYYYLIIGVKVEHDNVFKHRNYITPH